MGAALPWTRVARERRLKRQQILHQVRLLVIAELKIHTAGVVVDDVQQCGKAAIMIEPALLMRKQSRQRRGTVNLVWGTVGLRAVDADDRRQTTSETPESQALRSQLGHMLASRRGRAARKLPFGVRAS